MNAPTTVSSGADWVAANQRWLAARFELLKQRLDAAEPAAIDAAEADVQAARAAMRKPPALERLASLLDLSNFERDLVLLCAGSEMDAEVARRVARALGRGGVASPTFGLALGLLEDPHWSALTPAATLRRLRLIEPETGHPLSQAPLHLDERVLHLLAGINDLDARLQPLLMPLPRPTLMASSHAQVVRAIAGREYGAASPVIVLHGDDAGGQEDVLAQMAWQDGLTAYRVRAEDLPRAASDIASFAALWEREARLLSALLVVQGGDTAPDASLHGLVERLDAPLALALREPLALRRAVSIHAVCRPPVDEQRELWRAALPQGARASDEQVETIAGTFRLGARAILAAARDDGAPYEDAALDLWTRCRAQARRSLDELATRIDSRATWDELVLPDAPLQALRQMSAQLRHRRRVHHEWGFEQRQSRGLGLSALFWGESGTGKTLAAEVLAGELSLDLYRIDLSALVSKYIGETEKNLRKVFDAAEESGAILLFDEADALFGKRSEVKDSHDRYANIEVGYLLTRMESYRGLAILTTNLKSSLDPAFLRRLRFIVHFPFPDAAHRERIWRRSFPPCAPTRALDFDKLSRLHVPGGAIRNIALNAAFLAADTQDDIGMAQLLQAARSESTKLERPLSEAETRGWT